MHARQGIASLFLLLSSTRAADSFDCKPTTGTASYDLTPLAGVHYIEVSDPTPPSITKYSYAASLCGPIPKNSSLADADQCPPGTRVCLTVTNEKPPHADRITRVSALAGEIGEGPLNPEVSIGAQQDTSKPAPLVIKFHGGAKERTTEMTLLCDPTIDGLHTIGHTMSYTLNQLSISWASKYACATTATPPSSPGVPGTPTPPTQAQKGWGFFSTLFYLIFFAILLYFIVGAWVQRTQYGATGWDLIPHRDYWREAPYIVRDLFTRRGGSSGGYQTL